MSLRTVSDYWRDGASEMSEMRQSPLVWGLPRPEIRQLADAMTISNGDGFAKPSRNNNCHLEEPLLILVGFNDEVDVAISLPVNCSPIGIPMVEMTD